MTRTLRNFIFLLLNACCVLGSTLEILQQRIVVNSSELCILPITAALFKWEWQSDFVNQVEYIPKLANAPDLPSWLYYTYDGRSSTGYIYGVPPPHLSSINLDVIGWNRGENYDVRKLIISMEIVARRESPLKYVVELKIDNFNIKDMASPRRMGDLVNILKNELSWVKKDAEQNRNAGTVVPVFMASAVALGENRVPMKPNDAEGVVIHFGSDVEFSKDLKNLQIEVLPLWKLRSCPRDLKRTSKEVIFRKSNFLVDWCSFRLTTLSDSSSLEEDVGGGGLDQNKGIKMDGDVGDVEFGTGSATLLNLPSEPDVFTFRSKTEIPERVYSFEILLATLIPGSIGGLVGFLLIVLLRNDRDEDAAIDRDALFFEAAFRTLFSILRIKQRNGNGSQFIYHQTPQQDAGVVVMTRDNGLGHHPLLDGDRDMQSTPIPPQYAETHPNGAPALIYAV